MQPDLSDEPLLPAEVKLITWSLVLGVALLRAAGEREATRGERLVAGGVRANDVGQGRGAEWRGGGGGARSGRLWGAGGGGRGRPRAGGRRIEGERAPPPPRTAVSG